MSKWAHLMYTFVTFLKAAAQAKLTLPHFPFFIGKLNHLRTVVFHLCKLYTYSHLPTVPLWLCRIPFESRCMGSFRPAEAWSYLHDHSIFTGYYVETAPVSLQLSIGTIISGQRILLHFFTLSVRAAIYLTSIFKLTLSYFSLRHWAVLTSYTSPCGFAGSCGFDNQSHRPILWHCLFTSISDY